MGLEKIWSLCLSFKQFQKNLKENYLNIMWFSVFVSINLHEFKFNIYLGYANI